VRTPDLAVEEVERLHALLEASPRGACPVYVELRRPREYALTLRADPGIRVTPTPELTTAIEGLFGKGSVKLRVRGL